MMQDKEKEQIFFFRELHHWQIYAELAYTVVVVVDWVFMAQFACITLSLCTSEEA